MGQNVRTRRDIVGRIHHGAAVHVAVFAHNGIVADYGPAGNEGRFFDSCPGLYGGIGFNAAALLELGARAHVCRGVHENRGGNVVLQELLGELAAQFRVPDGHESVMVVGGELREVIEGADNIFTGRVVEEGDALEDTHGIGDFFRHYAILARPEDKEGLVQCFHSSAHIRYKYTLLFRKKPGRSAPPPRVRVENGHPSAKSGRPKELFPKWKQLLHFFAIVLFFDAKKINAKNFA